ncbi:hypothetical protein JOD45_000301 [Scopulibacillus daqui]|uniref:Uncharacterized protein n=1 Tax=Scopulibacillus daqui TaxID=1469162 RepID=A0ABS2PWL8_9BACL|nr:hypothetical protein [Scopulibacillus daqui]
MAIIANFLILLCVLPLFIIIGVMFKKLKQKK